MDNRENQTIEWKESWKDEYLKWICGYCNAYGGKLYIGKDDDGNVCGVDDVVSLLTVIPNKITDTMGIIADVNHLEEDGKDYIEIIVDKYPTLISFRGKYYYRSGSTMREITGVELNRALLKTQGRTWDGLPIPKLSVDDLKQDAIDYFKEKSVRKGRLSEEDVNVSNEILMDNLHLIDDGYLLRAAMMAFHKDPEKWITGAYIKIGYFGKSDSDLLYQDEVHGPLIEQVDKTIDLVYTKYLKALIYYEDIHRVERFMVHREAFREILLNAVVHKEYAGCNPIQISVYEDKIYVWNDAVMPDELNTTEKLFAKHSSKPFNPKLADVFFKGGFIEAWGRGFDKIKEACEEYDEPLPEYDISGMGVMVLCKACPKYMELLNKNNKDSVIQNETSSETSLKQVLKQVLDEKNYKKVLPIIDYLEKNKQITPQEAVEVTGKSRATAWRYLNLLIDADIIEPKGDTNKKVYVLKQV